MLFPRSSLQQHMNDPCGRSTACKKWGGKKDKEKRGERSLIFHTSVQELRKEGGILSCKSALEDPVEERCQTEANLSRSPNNLIKLHS